jgi:branched-chain amino acid transport system substrate-binding protein
MPTAQIVPSFSSSFRLPSLGQRLEKPARRPRCFPSVLPILFLILALGSQVPRAAADDSPADIVLGMSTVLTGVAGDLGKDMQRGVLAGLGRANRNGGVNGRKLGLLALDDGYEPARTATNMRQLIEKDKVLAVIGNVGSPTAIVAVPLAIEGN